MVYAVSHDLRQPLNQVIRLLEMLGEDAGARLGDSASLLEKARQSASRLDGMIEAVLRCARIGGADEAFAPVDLTGVFDRVLDRLAPERVATGARVTHGPLPVVEGNEAQLEQLLQNLLDNALKFHGRAHPRVRVEAADEGSAWHLSVRDHGIGIAPEDAERVFLLFQRLHTAQEAPGSGIGLAVCRRVVARHGGRIWVESTPGDGATFHVTLPKRAARVESDARRD
jgi:signal transduction histidine kinase